MKIADTIGFPIIIRASFTLGGVGSGVVYTREEFLEAARAGIEASPIGEILVEESILGWKEYELEVMRDSADNCVVICSIENFDPMGVHTGDSITVAPSQTLTDREYQIMRDQAFKVIRAIGVDTGGSNIQFAVNPKDGRIVVIEMNPRVSRSSALASKATGFPIAKIASLLAVGYRLDEIPNDITKKTPASFEPTIDYCVVKIPRFAFEKFTGADQTLNTAMKSVGEVMALGRTFKESLQKALRGLEIGAHGLGYEATRKMSTFEKALHGGKAKAEFLEEVKYKLRTPNCERIFYIKYAMKAGMTPEEIAAISGIDLWFLRQMQTIIAWETRLPELMKLTGDEQKEFLFKTKQLGFSDKQIAHFVGMQFEEVRELRKKLQVQPVYKLVDTCAAEFDAYTPYFYSTYDQEDDVKVGTRKKKVMILGAGPNRIGQGIEFDYSVSMPCWRCVKKGMRPSWSTATLKQCPLTTISLIVCTLNH
jgi:carbamoyl-phosphate synthase large subunit